MIKFTPGPWFFAYSDNATPHIVKYDLRLTHHHDDEVVDDCLICVMPSEIYRSYNSSANGRLIAEAPTLYRDLFDAALQLRKYERLHIAKGTAESFEKAAINGDLAERFEATLARARGDFSVARSGR